MKIQLFMQIKKQTTYSLWVMPLCKKLTILHYMQKKCTVKTLLNQVNPHYNGDNSYLFVNGKQELKFK